LCLKFHIFKISFLFALFLGIEGCDNFSISQKKEKKCIAQYKKECLSSDEINGIIQSINKKDSAFIVEKYIQEWKLEQALYEEAKNNISIDEEELEQIIRKSKKQYYITKYIQNYLKENLDTSVSYQEIVEYYQKNKSAFKLSNNILQIFYVKLKDNDKEINEFKQLLIKSKDKNKLTTFIIERAMSYFIEDSLWLKWDDVTKEIPALKNYDINRLNKGKIMEWKDGENYYYLVIKDIKVKDEYSPIVYEQGKIKQAILNERKKNLIIELKTNIAKGINQ